jgi:hypothetical protein
MFAGVEEDAAWRKDNERPFLPGMRLKNAAPIEKKLGLPGAKDNVIKTRQALVANAVTAARDGIRFIHYSRDNSWYADNRRYLPLECSCKSVVTAIDHLKQAELIVDHRMPPASDNEFRSRFEPQPKLNDIVAAAGDLRTEITRQEVLILHNENKRLIDYPDTVRSRRMRADIQDHNESLRDLVIDVRHLNVAWLPNGLLSVPTPVANIDTSISVTAPMCASSTSTGTMAADGMAHPGSNFPKPSARALPSMANRPSRRTSAVSTRAYSTQPLVSTPVSKMGPTTPTSSMGLTATSRSAL